ncbi:hypothetical protein [Streptomyces sp. NRRL F-5135]|uniref:hypothetical protein n=1 Tax=Streptomyces sp. NRRL F-5135 TaxID=1463858 RepID=UPI0004CACBE9|nr:hypothetical protein [Streptomyces sp. NRRL F-5135]
MTTNASKSAREFKALKAACRLAGLTAEDRHLIDPADDAFAAMASEHPDTCSTDTDYPDWTPGGQR